MRLFYFVLLLISIASTTACSSKSSETPQQFRKTEPISGLNNDLSLEQTISQLQRDTYSAALRNLELASEKQPDIQRLIQHPNATYKIFEGCLNYWRDLSPVEERNTKEWELNTALSYRQNFPRMAEYIRMYPIEDGRYLVIMPCWFGPYWEATADYIYDETEAEPQVETLVLPTYKTEINQIVPSESNINYGLQRYDKKSRVLTLGHKYSGTGTCRFEATYSLEGNELILTEFRERKECNGNNPSIDFPVVYP